MKTRKSRGYTLIEIGIVLAVLGVCLILMGEGVTRCSSSQNLAEEEARDYAQKILGVF